MANALARMMNPEGSTKADSLEYMYSEMLPFLNQRPNYLQQTINHWLPQLQEVLGPGLKETLAGGYTPPTADQIWENPLYSALNPENLSVAGMLIGPKSALWKKLPQVGELAGTKVVDEAGQPLRVFHGTNKPFYNQGIEFDTFAGKKTEERHGSAALGSFFTNDPEVAGIYTGRYKSGGAEGANIIAAHLDIKNPYLMSVQEMMSLDTVSKALKRRKALEKQGFDGIIQKGVEGLPDTEMRQIVAFKPSQIHNALAGPPETYPQGAFSSLYDKTPMVEISDDAARLIQPNNAEMLESQALKLREQLYKDQDMMRRLDEHAMSLDPTSEYDQIKQANDVYEVLQNRIKQTSSNLEELYAVGGSERSFKAPQAYEHDLLYQAYPELKENTVRFTNEPGARYGGQEVTLGLRAGREEAGHELQHAVQEREGWARGGNPASETTTYSKHDYAKEIIEGMNYKLIQKGAPQNALWDAESILMSKNPWDAMIDYDRLSDQLGIPPSKWENMSSGFRKLMSEGINYPQNNYTNLLGEIQARDTASRNALSLEQRTTNPPIHPLAGQGGLDPSARWGPMSTEMVPLSDVIIRRGEK